MAEQRSLRHIDRFLVLDNSVLLLPLVGGDLDVFCRDDTRRIGQIILGSLGFVLSLVHLFQDGAEGD